MRLKFWQKKLKFVLHLLGPAKQNMRNKTKVVNQQTAVAMLKSW
jgi:hypothetical protein